MKLEYRHNNGYDTILLIDGSRAVSAWEVTPKVMVDYLDRYQLPSDWDNQQLDHNPDDFGELLSTKLDYPGGGTCHNQERFIERKQFHLSYTENCAALERILDHGADDLYPESIVIRDGNHRGTLFAWTGREWYVADIENREFRGIYSRLAVVKLNADPDDGLNNYALGYDLDAGEWVIDALDIDSLGKIYGNHLTVLWSQQ